MKTDERADVLAKIHESMASGIPLSQPLRELDDPDLLSTVSVMRCIDRVLLSGQSTFLPPKDDSSMSLETAWRPTFASEPVQIGRFETVRLLGYGGCGVVFQAFDTQLRRFVALKLPRDDQLGLRSCREEFLREAQAGAVLDHPLIVPVYEMGEFGGTVFIVTGHVEGIDLATWLNRYGDQLAITSVRDLIRTLANTVEYMHSRGILHCDLKPSNILMVEGPGPFSTMIGVKHWSPRITDFGLARALNPDVKLTPTSTSRATRAYMAPEQSRGLLARLAPSTDVYLLGAILYELLIKLPQFCDPNLRGFAEFAFDGLIDYDLTDQDACRVAEILRKCVAQSPELRYSCAADLADELGRIPGETPDRSRQTSRLGLLATWVSDHRRVQGAVIALGLSMLAFLIWNFLLMFFQ